MVFPDDTTTDVRKAMPTKRTYRPSLWLIKRTDWSFTSEGTRAVGQGYAEPLRTCASGLGDRVTAQKKTPIGIMRRAILGLLVVGLGLAGCDDPVSPDESVVVNISETAAGASVGSIRVEQTADGARFTPNLTGLTPGAHGFHVHVNPSCGMAGQDAGGHYDPQNTGRHEGPNGEGHLGDLPTLLVNSSGAATTPVVAPRVTVRDLDGRSLMIHAGGDNYSDTPAPLGGGGARVACGVVPNIGM